MTTTVTALYTDIWAGKVPCFVQAFKTKRMGASVVRYRWATACGIYCASGQVFTSPHAAAQLAQRDHRFTDIMEA